MERMYNIGVSKRYLAKTKFMKKFDYLIIVLTLLVFFVMNRIIPFYGDDIIFSFLRNPEQANVQGVIDKVFAKGGLARVWCVFFNVMFASFWGNMAFDIANTVALGVSLYVFGKVILPKHTNRILGWGVFLLLFFSLTTAKDTLFYWGAGGCFYIIPLVLVYLFLYWFKFVYDDNKHDSILYCLIVLLGSFVLNLHHEMYVCIMLGTFFVYALINWKKDKNLRRPIIWMFFIGTCLAFAYLLFAGDAMGRVARTGTGLTALVRNIVKSMIDVRIVLLLLVILSFSAIKQKKQVVDFMKINFYWFVALLCALVPPVIAGTGGRALFALEVIAAIILVKWIYFVQWDTQKISFQVGIGLLVIFYGIQMAFALDYHKKWTIFETAMQRFIHQDGTTVVAEDYKGIQSRWTLNLDQTFTDHWFVYGYESQKSVWRHMPNRKVVVIPASVLNTIKLGTVFRKENLIAGDAGFYHIPNTDYFIRKYDSNVAKRINEGLLMVDNTCILGGKQVFNVKLVHIKEQLAKRNVINISDNPNMGYIFIYNKETKIPLTEVTNISFVEPKKENKWMQISF